MPRFARIDTLTNEIVEFATRDVSPGDAPHKNIAWLVVTEAPRPGAHLGEVVEGPFYAIEGGFVVESWTVRSKNAEELTSDVDAKIARIGAETQIVLSALDARVAVLEGKQSGGFLSFIRGLFS
jgi:hypothetical protein